MWFISYAWVVRIFGNYWIWSAREGVVCRGLLLVILLGDSWKISGVYILVNGWSWWFRPVWYDITRVIKYCPSINTLLSGKRAFGQISLSFAFVYMYEFFFIL